MSNKEMTYGYDYGDEDVPEIDQPQYQHKMLSKNAAKQSSGGQYDNVEPLPESTRPRKDGPGGE